MALVCRALLVGRQLPGVCFLFPLYVDTGIEGEHQVCAAGVFNMLAEPSQCTAVYTLSSLSCFLCVLWKTDCFNNQIFLF